MRGSTLGPCSLLRGPSPGEPGFAPREAGEILPLPCPSLTVGALSNCTKVAVVPVLPPQQVGSLLPVLSLPRPLLPSRTISLFLVFLGSSALYVCVWGWGWVPAGVGLVGVGKG